MPAVFDCVLPSSGRRLSSALSTFPFLERGRVSIIPMASGIMYEGRVSCAADTTSSTESAAISAFACATIRCWPKRSGSSFVGEQSVKPKPAFARIPLHSSRLRNTLLVPARKSEYSIPRASWKSMLTIRGKLSRVASIKAKMPPGERRDLICPSPARTSMQLWSTFAPTMRSNELSASP